MLMQKQTTFSTRGYRFYGKRIDRCYWIRCGHKNKMTKDNDCNYSVHQWCVGLYYKTGQKLKFFCEEHGLKKQT